MKQKFKETTVFLIPMISIAAILYISHFLIFGSLSATISGIILSLGYVPIGVIYETIIINKILEQKEKIKIDKKSTIIKGSFFHDVGNKLLSTLSSIDNDLNIIVDSISIELKSSSFEIERLRESFNNHTCDLDTSKLDIKDLSKFLENNDELLLNLVLNPLSFESEPFYSLILELIHFRDEINPKNKCTKDQCVIEYSKYNLNDATCIIYNGLIFLWLDYMTELTEYYPTLVKRELRYSPFACL